MGLFDQYKKAGQGSPMMGPPFSTQNPMNSMASLQKQNLMHQLQQMNPYKFNASFPNVGMMPPQAPMPQGNLGMTGGMMRAPAAPPAMAGLPNLQNRRQVRTFMK